MPFVQRVVEPKYLSRTSLRNADGRPLVADEELQAVTNCTLSNALKQLASLVLLANDIFNDLTLKLNDVTERSKCLQVKIVNVGEIVEKYDPKKVTVPEDSLSNFAARKAHYTAKHPLGKELFTTDTRPQCVRDLYATAGAGVAPAARDTGSPYLLCTPVLGAKRRRLRQKVDVDIETRIPASVEHLRRWTSKEALGSLTALPDASTRIAADVTLAHAPDEPDCVSADEEPIDHKLPSPEEQLEVIVAKFPPELVPINTSGKFFDRMSVSRKSLLHVEAGAAAAAGGDADAVRRRTRTRKPRGKRRNTISGTDQKELREAIAGDAPSPVGSPESPDSGAVMRSHSSDLLKKSPIDLTVKKSSHFNSLKQWGKTRLKLIGRSPSTSRDNFREGNKTDKTKLSKSPTEDIDDVNIYETVTMRRRRNIERTQDRKIVHQRNASYSSSDKSMGIPVSIPIAADPSVRLRESSAQKRLRRSGLGKDEPHSSSGNWSASSESGRTSIGSEITTTTIPPKSTTSATTSNNSLNAHAHGPPSSIISRRRFLNTSGSGSATSEGTLTPDIIHDLHEDMETSSEYSCDTEGYYTSFHMDSGLKTLKEEDTVPTTPLHTSNTLTNSSGNQTAENEYELFGKGSTSTTTSSAGTVCTTLMAAGSDRSLVIGPVIPERKSSLNKSNRSRNVVNGVGAGVPNVRFNKATTKTTDNVKFDFAPTAGSETSNPVVTITTEVGRAKETVHAEVHSAPEQDVSSKSTGTNSPDSGHNTSSSPIEDSISSPQGKHSLSEQDYSESSDLEGTDRIERIRVKTTINSSRIPSMCVITPTNSDDESGETVKKCSKADTDRRTDENIALRPKMDLPGNARFVPQTDTSVHRDGTSMECSSVKCTSTQKCPPTISMKSPMTLNNFMCKLKGVLPHKLSMKKSPNSKEIELPESLYSESGDYVTIADVRNNNQKMNIHKGGGIYYANDTIKKNLQTVLSGKLQETEYVSLNELPLNSAAENRDVLDSGEVNAGTMPEDNLKRHGAKVTLDSNGKVIYSSDSMRRRKGAHTTFEPGPFVKEIYQSPTCTSSTAEHISTFTANTEIVTKPLSPQLGKVIIKAANEPNGAMTTEFISYPPPKPNTIITATTFPEKSERLQHFNYQVNTSDANGAYVNIHDAEGVSLSPTKENATDYRHSSADQPYLNISPQSTQRRSLRHPLYSYIDKHPQESNTIPRDMGKISNMTQNKFGQIIKDNPYWTLQPKKFTNALVQDQSTLRSVTPDITRGLKYKDQHMRESTTGGNYNIRAGQSSYSETNSQNQYRGVHTASTLPQTAKGYSEELKISPIDPRNTGAFHSSTPAGKDVSTDLNHKLLSPGKSTMSNEELYAVIHKSKKKLNIKEQIDRAGSPALSSLSLSPVNSESSLTGRNTPVKQPESGYLGNPRVRYSWADSKENQFVPNVINMPSKLEYSMAGPGSRQSWACSDRLGPVPQTSRLDFKKLLLQHGVKLNSLNPSKNTNKVSAVEQLKLSKEKNQVECAKPSQTVLNNVNILDLSGSPKTYANRRLVRNPPVPQPLSPVRTNPPLKDHKLSPKILLSPKTQWRFASPRSDVLSSPIPEAFNEEESPNNSGEKSDSKSSDGQNSNPANTVAITTKQHFGARRNLIPINESSVDADSDFTFIDKGIHSKQPLETDFNVAKPFADNYCMSRTEILQAKRAEFFQQPPPVFTTFKKPTTTTTKFSRESAQEQQCRTPSPPTLETAL